MLLLLPIPFLAVGCICFIVCAALPFLRRFALGLSMWFAAWGFILTGTIIVLMLLLVGGTLVKDSLHLNGTAIGTSLSSQFTLIGMALLIVTAAITTGVVALHGIIVRRVTLSLFRIYVIAVSFGVGLLSATPISFTAVRSLHFSTLATSATAIPMVPVLAGLLAWFCGTHAQDFRSKRPERLNPIAPTEYGIA